MPPLSLARPRFRRETLRLPTAAMDGYAAAMQKGCSIAARRCGSKTSLGNGADKMISPSSPFRRAAVPSDLHALPKHKLYTDSKITYPLGRTWAAMCGATLVPR